MPNNSSRRRHGLLGLPGNMLLAVPAAFYSALVNYALFAAATPIPNQLTSDTSSSSQNNSANRGNSFQILADGTQDLTALVGLFATDGVERYTIDSTRRFLPPATAPLSLLGLLGYVRGLLKMSLGIQS